MQDKWTIKNKWELFCLTKLSITYFIRLFSYTQFHCINQHKLPRRKCVYQSLQRVCYCYQRNWRTNKCSLIVLKWMKKKIILLSEKENDFRYNINLVKSLDWSYGSHSFYIWIKYLKALKTKTCELDEQNQTTLTVAKLGKKINKWTKNMIENSVISWMNCEGICFSVPTVATTYAIDIKKATTNKHQCQGVSSNHCRTKEKLIYHWPSISP